MCVFVYKMYHVLPQIHKRKHMQNYFRRMILKSFGDDLSRELLKAKVSMGDHIFYQRYNLKQ